MRAMKLRRGRRGITVVEGALILTAFLTLVVGMLDFAVPVLREHILSQAARQGVRAAIVHGSRATVLAPWGPGQFGPVAASSGDPKAQVVAKYLAGIDPSTVTITYQWLDGNNAPE